MGELGVGSNKNGKPLKESATLQVSSGPATDVMEYLTSMPTVAYVMSTGGGQQSFNTEYKWSKMPSACMRVWHPMCISLFVVPEGMRSREVHRVNEQNTNWNKKVQHNKIRLCVRLANARWNSSTLTRELVQLIITHL